MVGERFDASSDPGPFPIEGRSAARRPFLGIQFACCAVYARIYPNREQDAYQGNCPRCGKPVTIRIGAGGTRDRFFTVD